ncbi:hypothetical protein [Flavobacterium sp.]|uniref:hypothetical protein n=1 Tax=Flavobacterium sp. TaxID=239 RepID=UPI002603FCFA|nr:hypothetical protein [Flavobacterium sp.]
MKKILPFFSYLFHPVFIPLMATLFYFYYNETLFELKEKGFVLLQITILTIVVPILIYFLLKALNKIDSVMAYDLNQRKIPLVLQSFLFIVLIKRSITIDRYFELHFFFLAALMGTLIALLLLFAKIKASIHMLAFSSLTVFVIGLHLHHPEHFSLIVPFLIFMNGVIASSRLVMKAHTPKELIIGFFSGAIPQLLLLVVWL